MAAGQPGSLLRALRAAWAAESAKWARVTYNLEALPPRGNQLPLACAQCTPHNSCPCTHKRPPGAHLAKVRRQLGAVEHSGGGGGASHQAERRQGERDAGGHGRRCAHLWGRT